jgi:cysteine desulfurase
MQHICASGGSACSSGAQQGSHVIAALNKGTDIVTIRFSFSKQNTTQEIDQVITTLLTILK